MIRALIKQTKLYQAFRKGRLYDDLQHARRFSRDAEYRERTRAPRADFQRFCETHGGLGLREDVFPRDRELKTALIMSQYYLPFAKIEAVVIKAFQMAGYRTVIMGDRRYEVLRYGWLAGNREVIGPAEFVYPDESGWVDEQVENLRTLDEWLELTFEGVHVGRFVVASALRSLRAGTIDFGDPAVRSMLGRYLTKSARHAFAARRTLDTVRPDAVLVMDRGYSGYGEMFDSAINRGVDTLVWSLGYKSNRLVFKRYHASNERDHQLSLSAATWKRLEEMPWTEAKSEELRNELFQTYESQDWFSLVGTQFDKRIMSKSATRDRLGISGDRKVGVIFAHILWDGSFFSGKDIFEDYTEWFVETIRAAIANDRMQWLVKLHPAHVVKAKQDGAPPRPAELDVIEKAFGTLPAHIKLIYSDTDVSTYSLFEVADYTITVRGTVGIESALFGIPVVTAGTGRYDRRGFTVDSTSREDYLNKLAILETYPRMSADQVELAARYAWGVFLWRPLALSAVSLEFGRDAKALPIVNVRCQTRDQWLASPDMQRLSQWIADGRAEDMRAP